MTVCWHHSTLMNQVNSGNDCEDSTTNNVLILVLVLLVQQSWKWRESSTKWWTTITHSTII